MGVQVIHHKNDLICLRKHLIRQVFYLHYLIQLRKNPKTRGCPLPRWLLLHRSDYINFKSDISSAYATDRRACSHALLCNITAWWVLSTLPMGRCALSDSKKFSSLFALAIIRHSVRTDSFVYSYFYYTIIPKKLWCNCPQMREVSQRRTYTLGHKRIINALCLLYHLPFQFVSFVRCCLNNQSLKTGNKKHAAAPNPKQKISTWNYRRPWM